MSGPARPPAWLVTGGRGQLGSDLQLLLAGQDVVAVDLPEVDLAGDGVVEQLVADWSAARSGAPLVCVNAAAFTAVDAAEEQEELAHRVNAEVPGRLASACARAGARLVHVSTDYVFAGDATTPYPEDAEPAPRGAYGRTKLAGERAVLAAQPSAYVVRTAWVYGAAGRNFVKTMARLERERETLDVVDDQRGSPTWSRELASGLLALLRAAPQPGVYHLTGRGDTTWCGLARAVFEELGADPARVRPTTTEAYPLPAPRPAYSVLGHARWDTAGLPAPAHWRDALRAAFREVGEALRAG